MSSATGSLPIPLPNQNPTTKRKSKRIPHIQSETQVREKKKERNRLAAAKCREKKQKKIDDLTVEKNELIEERDELRNELAFYQYAFFNVLKPVREICNEEIERFEGGIGNGLKEVMVPVRKIEREFEKFNEWDRNGRGDYERMEWACIRLW